LPITGPTVVIAGPIFAIDDSGEYYLQLSEGLDISDHIGLNSLANKIVEAFTGEDDLLSDQSSHASPSLSDGTLNIKPRAYQLRCWRKLLGKILLLD
jgi:hypothetical protein